MQISFRKSLLATILTITAVGAFNSCGRPSNPGFAKPTPAISPVIGDSHFVAIDRTLTQVGPAVEGSGRIRSATDLESTKSRIHYELKFYLSEGGSLELSAFSSSLLDQGVHLTFSRNGHSLMFNAKADGAKMAVDSKFEKVDAAKTIHLEIDVHNDENPAHVVIWESAKSFERSVSLFDSQENVNTQVPGIGHDRHWGLTLKNARVSFATMGTAKLSIEESGSSN